MSAYITAAARTPWAPRQSALATARPEALLATVIEAALDQAGREPSDVARLLVACDVAVGAQDLNLARRAGLELGWLDVAGLTVDGQGVGGLASVDIAASISGVTVVAAIDVTSLVPPGAGLVRDYGRPTLAEPELAWLERMVRNAALDASGLDAAAARLSAVGPRPSQAIVPVWVGSTRVEGDVGVALDAAPADLDPLTGPGGLLTAAHEAQLADGAAAIVVEHDPLRLNETARAIVNHELTAGPPETVLDRLRSATGAAALLADSSVALHELLGWENVGGVPPVPALGSTPSADGLRLLVDAYHATGSPCTVLSRGRHGQTCAVELGELPTAGGTAEPGAYAE